MSFNDQVQLGLIAIMVLGFATNGVRHIAKRKGSLIEAAGDWLCWMAGSTGLLIAAEML